MKRWSAFGVVVVVVVGVAFVAGASHAPGARPAEEKPEAAKPAVGHKTAVFNMAAVMRDFHQAKYRVWLLNKKKDELSKKLLALRQEYIRLQQEVQLPAPPQDPGKVDGKAKQLLELARQIEDEDRKIQKQLNDDATVIIAGLYDKIKEVVDKTAEKEGFQLVLAYPDAVTPDELHSPYIKELKLKPPAAQPFHVAREIDLTARVIETLNELYPTIDQKTGKPVDVSKLDVPPPAAAPPGQPTPPPLPNVPGAAPKRVPPVPAPSGRP